MKRLPFKPLLLAILLALTPAVSSAECTDLDAQSKPAQWQHDPLPAVPQVPVRAVMKRLGAMLEAVLTEPRGYQPLWYGVMLDNQAQANKFAAPYGVSAPLFQFYCRNGVIRKVGETATWAYLQVNYLRDIARSGELNGKSYMWIKPQTDTRDGFPYREYQQSAWTNHVWLITRNGKLPYTPLTRKEYLAEARAAVEERIRSSHGDDNFYRKAIAAIEREQQGPADELMQPAIVFESPLSFRGFDDGNPNAEMPVRWNPAYFERGRHDPQFFVVVMRTETTDPVAIELAQQFMAGFDFRALERYLEPAGLGQLVQSTPLPTVPVTRRRVNQRAR